MFRPIDASSLVSPKDNSTYNPGPAPTLYWLKIEDLVVDTTYQREIGKRGRANIVAIVEGFEWPKFAPIIVAAIEGGRYAVVDGQHRTTAAAIRGLKSVPCQIIQADRLKQAQAYAAVNGAITKTTPQQLFHARVAAEEKLATQLQEILHIAGVSIVRNNRTCSSLKAGETQAIGAITRCYKIYGRETLITALQCVTQTSEGNAGYLRATIIDALCLVLNRKHDWRDAGSALLRAMDDFHFVEEWDSAVGGKSNVILSREAFNVLVERITDHLEGRLKTVLTATYREKAPRDKALTAPLSRPERARSREHQPAA